MTMYPAPKGQRECINCMLHHPERIKRPCSAYGECENKNKDCSLYIEHNPNAMTVEEFCRMRLARAKEDTPCTVPERCPSM